MDKLMHQTLIGSVELGLTKSLYRKALRGMFLGLGGSPPAAGPDPVDPVPRQKLSAKTSQRAQCHRPFLWLREV
jgi:hypothetical protein